MKFANKNISIDTRIIYELFTRINKQFTYLMLAITLLVANPIFSQQYKIDSLQKAIQTSVDDTNKVNALNELSKIAGWQIGNFDTANYYAFEARKIAIKINYQKGIANSYNNLGAINDGKSNYNEAFENYFTSLSIRKKISDWAGLAVTFNNIGNTYIKLGNYKDALKYHSESLTIRKKLKDSRGIATSNNNIGLIHQLQGNYSEALKNYFLAIKEYSEVNDQRKIATTLTNIGDAYTNLGDYTQALNHYSLAIKKSEEGGYATIVILANISICNIYYIQKNYSEALKRNYAVLKKAKLINDKDAIAAIHNNIGTIYTDTEEYTEALKNFSIALKLREETGNKIGIASVYANQGFIFYKNKNYSKALDNYNLALSLFKKLEQKDNIATLYCAIGNIYVSIGNINKGKRFINEALTMAKQIGAKNVIKNCYLDLYAADSASGSFKEALSNYKLYVTYNDSLLNKENSIKMAQMQMKSDFDVEEIKTKTEQEKKDALTIKEHKRQKQFIYIGISLLTIISVSFYSTRKQKKIIESQKTEAETQKHIIEEKNKDITDSINYAQLIQRATLPHYKDIKTAFANSFILFQPKDIVSGDFYYFHSIDNGNHIIAAADCTGHGVPGGFMTMLGAERLTDAINQSKQPSEILSLLNSGLKKSLKQTDAGSSSRDGMDIAICAVNTVNRMVQYSGANRPIWIIRKNKNEVEELKPTKCGIGGYTLDEQLFEQHTIFLEEGDSFYIFSDGYADLFNGSTGKKLTTKRFKEELLSIKNKTMHEQGKYLETFANAWKLGTEQIDDILVIGIRL